MPDGNIELSDSNFTKLRTIIHENTGITIGDSRKSLLISRLRGRLRETNDPDFRSYIARVSSDTTEMQELINRITTNKTYFYRTPRVWEHFTQVAVPEFQAKALKRPMRIWSGASSTGEEAHTVGILLEEVRSENSSFDYTILGTDVSSRVLEKAEAGIYSENTVSQFRKEKPELFTKHMVSDGKEKFRVGKLIRSKIKFQLHNLQNQLRTTGSFDAVFLRNVLIYFTNDDQENILKNVHAMMQPGSFLYIGESETLTRINTDFEIDAPMIYKPKETASRPEA